MWRETGAQSRFQRQHRRSYVRSRNRGPHLKDECRELFHGPGVARRRSDRMCLYLKSQESVLSAMASSTYSTSAERLLLREIMHRVNNEFASAIQVVSFTAAKSPDGNVKAALAGVMEQLHNYARVHHALQMPASNDDIDASAYLRELCRSISRSKLEHRNIELVLAECAFRMSSDRCWLMGMIVAELITNAVRHAFDRRGGVIRIECRALGEFIECRGSDNGFASTADGRPGRGLQ